MEQRCGFHVIGPKHKPHQQKGAVIEHRTDGADAEHEPAQVWHSPTSRGAQVLRVDGVERDGGLGQVVQEILHKKLHGGHREEGQHDAGAHNTEHIPEVGAGGHFHVLDDVHKRPPPLSHTPFQDQQVLLQKDDVRRILRDVSAGVHGNPDVGLLQCRGVVDAIAQEPQRAPVAAQGLHNATLLHRRELGKDIHPGHRLSQLSVREVGHIASQ